MERELTLGDVYEEIAERLAAARSKALMGERQEALGLFQGASLDFRRFREVLADYPGFHALEHAFAVTMGTLCAEQDETEDKTEEAEPDLETTLDDCLSRVLHYRGLAGVA